MMNHRSLSRTAHAAIENRSNEVFVSAATAWEITTKFRLGKFEEAEIVATDVAAAIAEEGFLQLSVSVAHGEYAGALPGEHRDPFDRMLIAQAILERMALVSNETRFDAFPVKRLW
jgi:PIN domain nuclease of toxin-antitoxin system